MSANGNRLHANAFKRATDWHLIAPGRRIHDLRHTAACLWLARGVSPTTVQAWMGHASIATTNIYLHHLGTVADRAGFDISERSGGNGGNAENHNSGRRTKPRLILCVVAGQAAFLRGAACRNRTDDLLITSETLYRLS